MPSTRLACACGKVRLELRGAPILSCECCCNSCRTAGRRIEALPAARPVLSRSGGTHFVLFRKDRVRFVEGAELLREFRLKPVAPTRRVVASCCNTPVFLEFQNGHWLSLYAGLWPQGVAPSPQLRTMTGDLPAGATLDDEIPNSKRQPASFMIRLLAAWAAMGFKSPRITVGQEALRS